MFNRFCRGCGCNPYKRWLSISLLVLGAILLIIFVPIELWMALLGIALIIIGIFLFRC